VETSYSRRPGAGPAKIESVIDILRAEKILTEDQIKEVLKESEEMGVPPVNILVSKKYVSTLMLTKYIAKTLNTPFQDLSDLPLESNLSKIIAPDFARRYNIIPIHRSGSKLTVAVPLKHALDLDLNDSIRRNTKLSNIEFVVSPTDQIEQAIKDLYRVDEELRKITETAMEEEAESSGVGEVNEAEVITDESDIEKFVRLSILQGIIDRASDILFESREDCLVLRYRIDGVWHEKERAPKNISDEIISVVKIMSDLDIAVRKRAQDGRMYVNHNGDRVDLRVNILPIQDGENITMRILDNSQANLRLEDLGFSENNLARFLSAIRKPYGMVLVTGPTGSGKSVTLYSGLNVVASPHKNIYTIEDPIEYRIENVKQSQINVKAGWNYPEAIRAFMRAAPDIILVGEIRDLETAGMALQAGMTGHLVLSTLHTNTSSEAPARLADLGVQAHITASTLSAVVAQRLVRRLCNRCKQPHTPTPDELLAAEFPWEEGQPLPQLFQPREGGCKECSYIGFRGRTAAHEILLVNEKIRTLISSHAQSHEIEAAAIEDGMSLMIQDGYQKVLAGITTIPEVMKSII
jgi:type IV pilus assembly protein PilB